MYFIRELNPIYLLLKNQRVVWKMPHDRVKLRTTGLFMGTMITQSLILIIPQYLGKVNTFIRGPTNGNEMVKFIWQRKPTMVNIISMNK